MQTLTQFIVVILVLFIIAQFQDNPESTMILMLLGAILINVMKINNKLP